jgi:DNA-binding phage protein
MKNRTEIVNELCAAIEQDRRSIFNIALAAGVDQFTLYRWLRGATANPRIDTIAKVAQVLGMQVAFIDGQPRLKPLSTPATAAVAAKRARMALWRLQ